MKIMSLDLSTKCSGWAVFEEGELTEYDNIPEQRYPLCSKDRYPVKSAKLGIAMANKIKELIDIHLPDRIVIEEASVTGRMGVKQVKGLIQLHGMVLDRIEDRLDTVTLIAPSGKNGWRPVLELKKNGDYKASAVKMTNEMFDLELVYDQHDIADAILIGAAIIELEG